MTLEQSENTNANTLQRMHLLVLFLGIAVVALAYIDALDVPFLWDDIDLLKQSCIRTTCSLPKYFRLPFWELHGAESGLLYRPFVSLSLAVDNYLHGQNSAGFHLTNLVFHLVNVGLFAALARRLGASGLVAALMAAFWGLLPRLTESVAWISGRTDILYTTPAILALLVWHPERRSRRLCAVLLGLVSALTKEAGVCILIGLVLAEAMSAAPRRRFVRALVPALALVGYFTLRATVVSLFSGIAPVRLSLGQRLATALESLGRYAWMTVDLWHPKAQIGVIGEPRWGYAALGLAVAALTGIVVYRNRRCRDAFVYLVAAVGAIPLLLVINLAPMPWVSVVGDRLGYLSWGIGSCVVAVWMTRLEARAPLTARLVTVVPLALAVSLVPSVQRRVHLFADEFGFWVQTVSDTAASNWGPTLNLAALYLRAGLPNESLAIVDSLDSRCLPAGDSSTKSVRAKVDALTRLGKYKEAEQRLLSLNLEKLPDLVLSVARLRLAQGDAKGAQMLAEKVTLLQVDDDEARLFQQTLQRAERLHVALAGASDDVLHSIHAAQIDMLSGRLVEAESKWRKLLALPDLPKDTADEAIAFECTFGSAATVPVIVADYANRSDADAKLLRGCQDKIEYAQRLLSRWPDVNEILVRKDSNIGHCREFGPFSD